MHGTESGAVDSRAALEVESLKCVLEQLWTRSVKKRQSHAEAFSSNQTKRQTSVEAVSQPHR